MDDTNVPSLLSLPYLGAFQSTDHLYFNTRKVVLSKNNPFFYGGKAGERIGLPHIGTDTNWPMSIKERAINSEGYTIYPQMVCMGQYVIWGINCAP